MYACIFIAIGISKNAWVIAVLFMLPSIIRWGFASLRSHYYLEFIEDSSSKASLLSMNSFFEKIMTGVIGFTMGYSVLFYGYSMSYFFTGIIFLIITVLSYFLLKKQLK